MSRELLGEGVHGGAQNLRTVGKAAASQLSDRDGSVTYLLDVGVGTVNAIVTFRSPYGPGDQDPAVRVPATHDRRPRPHEPLTGCAVTVTKTARLQDGKRVV